jgi:hypothetical protein
VGASGRGDRPNRNSCAGPDDLSRVFPEIVENQAIAGAWTVVRLFKFLDGSRGVLYMMSHFFTKSRPESVS